MPQAGGAALAPASSFWKQRVTLEHPGGCQASAPARSAGLTGRGLATYSHSCRHALGPGLPLTGVARFQGLRVRVAWQPQVALATCNGSGSFWM